MPSLTSASSSQPISSPPERRGPSLARQLALIVAVLGLGLGFITSYVGAFHRPTPHGVSLAVAAPGAAGGRTATRINAAPGHPLSAHVVTGPAAARAEVAHDQAAAALLINPRGSHDRLLVASGGGAALTSAVQAAVTRIERAGHRTITTRDLVPLQAGDYRGLSGFYAVVGWLVSGYLLASLLGIASGARVSTVRSVGSRLLILAAYSLAAGLGGSLVIDTLLGAQTGHLLALAGVGALLVFAAGAVTVALQELVGIIGIGLAILLFVVLGNPSAGGAYQLPLLPGFWRAIGDALPNGAGVDTIRRIVYFGAHGIGGHLAVIAAYCVAASVIALGVTAVRSRRTRDARGADTQTAPVSAAAV